MVRNLYFIATLSEIQMFYIKYLTMYKVRMHADAIRKLLYVCAYVRTTLTMRPLMFFMDIDMLAKYLKRYGTLL